MSKKELDIIDKYINNDSELENVLQQQIEFIKKKYSWENQADYLYNFMNN